MIVSGTGSTRDPSGSASTPCDIWRSVRAILVELVLALPGLLILLVLPSIVILAVLWNVRPVSTLRFRSVALVLLVLPAFLSRDLAQFGYAAAVGVVFALVMIRSRAADR